MPTNAWGDPMRRPVNGVNVNIKIQTEVTDEKGDVKDEYLDQQLLCMQHADVWCVLGGHTELLHEALSSWDPGGAHGLSGYLPTIKYVLPGDRLEEIPDVEYNHPIFVLNFEDGSNVHTDINQEPHLDQYFWRLVKQYGDYQAIVRKKREH